MSTRQFCAIRLSFGIELEGLVVRPSCPQHHNPRSQEALAHAVSNGIPNCRFCWRQRPDYTFWSVTQDASLEPPPSPPLSVGVELVSRILDDGPGDRRLVVPERSAWMAEIDTIGRAIVALRTAKDSIDIRGGQGTGFHVHVGIRDANSNNHFTLQDLQKIAMAVMHYEEQIAYLHPRHRAIPNDPYIFSNSVGMAVAAETVEERLDAILLCDDIPDLIRLFNPPRPGHNDDPIEGCRYYRYNFTSLNTLGTIEFRQPDGTFDAQKIKETVIFYLTFVRSCLVRQLDEMRWLDNCSEPINAFVKVIM